MDKAFSAMKNMNFLSTIVMNLRLRVVNGCKTDRHG